MNTHISLENAKAVLDQLSIADKIRLIEEILPEIKTALLRKEGIERPKLKGLWRGLDISDAEIKENQRDILQNFPREDFDAKSLRKSMGTKLETRSDTKSLMKLCNADSSKDLRGF